jgi:thiamine-monophosphate kinase
MWRVAVRAFRLKGMELEFVQWLREHIPTHPRAELGLSDDAALLSLGGHSDVVVTTDLLTDGVDFRVGIDDPRRIGRQAMAAKPLAAFISLALPRSGRDNVEPLPLAIGLYEGLLPLAAEFDVAIAGGDTNTYDGPLVISVAALGQSSERGPLTRSGGKVGDWLLVTGSLGGSILGQMFDFTPRVREAQFLHNRYELHAGIDISDGLAIDASRLAKESNCGAVIRTDHVPISPAAYELSNRELASNLDAAALQHALGDGQDFELLLAASPTTARAILSDKPVDCLVTHVGELIAERGLWQQSAGEAGRPLEAKGWLH